MHAKRHFALPVFIFVACTLGIVPIADHRALAESAIAKAESRQPLRLSMKAAINLGKAEAERLKSNSVSGFYTTTARTGRLLELQLIEGSRAHFASGQWRRIWEGVYRWRFGGGAYSRNRWEGDGLAVEVHVDGDYASVSIGASSTESGEDRDYILRQQNAEQVVRIPLGRWTDLGSVSAIGTVAWDTTARRIATDSRDLRVSLIRLDVLSDE